jgi:hypothetical protein
MDPGYAPRFLEDVVECGRVVVFCDRRLVEHVEVAPPRILAWHAKTAPLKFTSVPCSAELLDFTSNNNARSHSPHDGCWRTKFKSTHTGAF